MKEEYRRIVFCALALLVVSVGCYFLTAVSDYFGLLDLALIFNGFPALALWGFVTRRRLRSRATKPGTKVEAVASPVQANVVTTTTPAEKLGKIVKVSKSMLLDDLAAALGITRAGLMDKIIDWAAEFGFEIDGNQVVFGAGRKDDFIAQLEREFASWSKGGKI